MTDLVRILPSFRVTPFAALLPVIEKHALSTTDLLVLHPADIAKQTHLPLLDLKRLIAAVQASLSDDLVPTYPLEHDGPQEDSAAGDEQRPSAVDDEPEPDTADAPAPIVESPEHLISTLDDVLDTALGGGVPTGRITEFVGESGAGKTQVLLTLCLAVQLPPPRGLGKKALYISTEAALATRRLSQMMASHPRLVDGPASLDNILSTVTPDLESQDHILEYQVPVLLERHDVGLIVLDSVAANYRAEFDRHEQAGTRAANMATRSAELVKLGALLRNVARKHNVAVVVANQVADRFPSPLWPPEVPSSAPSSSALMPFPEDGPPPHPALRLDHQQRWFTGWGDDPRSAMALKTPSLGLVWSTQIACRVALLKRPVYGRPRRLKAPLAANDDPYDAAESADAAAPTLRNWRRWLKVVFAPHVAAAGLGLDAATEFEVTMHGVRAVEKKQKH